MEGPGFVEEIDYHELKFIQVVGRGAFGVVSQAKWREIDVAVKHIETDSEKKAFITELKQLSRVHHPNIVKLYGASTKSPVCLVMEYAEGGSLYNVLHGVEPQPDYTLGHAMSWCLQCALGVEYLHSMKPRPLVHRDLKPPNLLLIAYGTKLKICDFGTACDAHTHMTNNKGSAAWMAPEVFEGSKYSEKCDVFSWGIILWEVITRQKPFDEIGGSAFRIMWAVHNGTRPPLIASCPKSIQKLMTRCWSANPIERPSINEVARIMGILASYCEGGNEPLVYPSQETTGFSTTSGALGSIYDTPPPTNASLSTSGNSIIHALRDTIRQALSQTGMGEPVPVKQPVTPKVKPVVVEDENTNWRRTSAPASLAASRENLLDKSSRSSTPNIDMFKRYSADLSKLEEVDFMSVGAAMGSNSSKPAVHGHRRTGSHGTPFITTSPNTNLLGPNWSQAPKGRGHKRTGSFGNTPFKPSDLSEPPVTHAQTTHSTMGSTATSQCASNYRNNTSTSWSPVSGNAATQIRLPSNMTQEQMLNNMAQIPIDYRLQPLPPCESSQESKDIYEEHYKLAEQFYRLQVEIMVLSKRNKELQKELEEEEQEQLSNNQLVEQYQRLVTENENLDLLKKNLKKAMEKWKQEHEKEANTHSAQPRRL